MNCRPTGLTFSDWFPPRRPSPISSNTLFQAAVTALFIAHAGCLLGVWWAPRGITFMLGLSAIVAIAVLIYVVSRARHIFAAVDWPFLGLFAFETAVLGGAILALRGNRLALFCSYTAFGLHALAGIAGVVFAFVFKLRKLM